MFQYYDIELRELQKITPNVTMRFLRVRDAPNSRCHAFIPRREAGAAALDLDRTLRLHGRAH